MAHPHWPDFSGHPVTLPVACPALQFCIAPQNVLLMHSWTSVHYGGLNTVTHMPWHEPWSHWLGKNKKNVPVRISQHWSFYRPQCHLVDYWNKDHMCSQCRIQSVDRVHLVYHAVTCANVNTHQCNWNGSMDFTVFKEKSPCVNFYCQSFTG